MYRNKIIIAIIPARGGSKGIPRKNITPLCGKPLIYWTINEAKKSKYIDRLICSTDDSEIAKIAKKYGCEVPFLRPKELAQDDTPDLPVFVHALNWLKEHENYNPDIIVHLRPTTPLRTAKQIDEAIELLVNDENADSLRSICIPHQNPYKMWKIKNKYLKPLLKYKKIKESYNAPRQKLPKIYWHNGYIDIIRRETILKKNSMTGKKILPYIMPLDSTVDIDTPLSLKVAEILLKNILKIE